MTLRWPLCCVGRVLCTLQPAREEGVTAVPGQNRRAAQVIGRYYILHDPRPGEEAAGCSVVRQRALCTECCAAGVVQRALCSGCCTVSPVDASADTPVRVYCTTLWHPDHNIYELQCLAFHPFSVSLTTTTSKTCIDPDLHLPYPLPITQA